VYVCVYIEMCIYIYVYTYTCIYIYIYTRAHPHRWTLHCFVLEEWNCMSKLAILCMYIYIHMNKYIYVYIYIGGYMYRVKGALQLLSKRHM